MGVAVMARSTGRKRKAGKRTGSGRPSRAGIALFDHGSDWVQKMRERFGQDYNSALGRAYVAGLLGSDDIAKMRYDAGKKFVRIRRRVFAHREITCPLDQTPRGGSFVPDHERDLSDQQWLYKAMDSIEQSGCAPWFEQLLSTQHTDSGPYWLDRLLARNGTPLDSVKMEAAIIALDVITPDISYSQIRVAIAHD